MKIVYRLISGLTSGLMYGLAGWAILGGLSAYASPNLNVEGWIKNLTDSELKVIPFVWSDSAKATPSKGWIINTSRQPYSVKPGQSVMFDWINNGEINLFREIIRGARVEFVDGSHAPVEIWYSALARILYKSVAATVIPAENVISAACLKGPAENPTLSGSWIADGAYIYQSDPVNDSTVKISARGVSYPLASPDAEFIFRKP